MTQLEGLTAVITGAAGGIGRSLAEKFAEAGARLALIDKVDAGDLAASLGSQHKAYMVDLINPDDISRTISTIGDEMGIDLVINNAGVGMVFPAEHTRLDAWELTMAINVRAPWLIGAAALPFLKKSGRGRVVNMASKAGVVAIDQHAAYGASKAALINLTKVQALEWARFGITTNAISPTVVETPMALVGWSGEKGKQAKRDIPVGRFARPDEIAAGALYLCSADAGIINGANLMADGGYTIR